MYEARVAFLNGKIRTIEANTIEMLKMKCELYIEDDSVYLITVVEIRDVGFLKHNFDGISTL